MSLGFAVMILKESVLNLLLVSLPILVVAVGIGLIISIFQAITSIQEQTLTFVPKFFAILILMSFLGPWMGSMLINFTTRCFNMISSF